MTKHDYELLAKALCRAIVETDDLGRYGEIAFAKTVRCVSDALKADNDRFDEAKFTEAIYSPGPRPTPAQR